MNAELTRFMRDDSRFCYANSNPGENAQETGFFTIRDTTAMEKR